MRDLCVYRIAASAGIVSCFWLPWGKDGETRNLNQLARAANQGHVGRLTREDLLGLLKVCEGLRQETKDLLRVNVLSWEVGHVAPDR